MGKSRHLPSFFRSEDEAGRFIDSHDLADYDAEFEEVDIRFDIRRETYLFPVRRQLAERIAELARRKRIPSARLIEKLLSKGIVQEARSRG